MTTIEWSNTPLRDARDSIASIIETGTGLHTVTEWSGRENSGEVIVDGQGWKPLTGAAVVYDARVTVIWSGDGGEAAVEEAARQVYAALILSTERTSPIPEGVTAPGVVTQGTGDSQRSYHACQMVVQVQVDLGPIEVGA